MKSSRLHRYALLTAFCTLLLVATGAAVTSSRSQAKPVLSSVTFFENVHTAAALAVALLTVGLAICLSLAEKRAWLIRFGWITLAIGIAEGWLGRTSSGLYIGAIGTLHACLAAVLFVAFASIALGTSRTWNCEPDIVQDYGWPSLR